MNNGEGSDAAHCSERLARKSFVFITVTGCVTT